MAELDGKSIIVTGASRGIGAEAARALSAAGAKVMLLARNAQAIAELSGEIRRAGGVAESMTCDVAVWSQVSTAVARTREAFGDVDVMINNAGVIEPIGPMSDSDPAAWTKAADINFNGVFFGIRAVLPLMRAKKSGVIINVSSGAAHNPLEGWSQYCATKAAAAMLTRCADLENRGAGVQVYGLSPGTVATDMQRAIKASGINPVSQMDFADHAPPSHAAQALVWLCTADAAEFAGQEVSLRDPAIRARVGLET